MPWAALTSLGTWPLGDPIPSLFSGYFLQDRLGFTTFEVEHPHWRLPEPSQHGNATDKGHIWGTESIWEKPFSQLKKKLTTYACSGIPASGAEMDDLEISLRPLASSRWLQPPLLKVPFALNSRSLGACLWSFPRRMFLLAAILTWRGVFQYLFSSWCLPALAYAWLLSIWPLFHLWRNFLETCLKCFSLFTFLVIFELGEPPSHGFATWKFLYVFHEALYLPVLLHFSFLMKIFKVA